MKLNGTMKVKVIGKGTEQSKDGKTTYYRLLVMQDMEAGKLGCPEDVYNLVKEGETFTLNTQFNDEYKSFRIIGMVNDGIPSAATTPGGRCATTPTTVTK